MCYTNVLNMLDMAGIPVRTEKRGEEDPFVVAGGPCVYNAEPVAAFFDLFFIGEAEQSMEEFIDCLKQWKEEGKPGGREGFLRRAAKIAGIYVPSLYEVSYEEDGRFREIHSKDGAPLPIYKRIIQNVDDVVIDDRPILPHIEIVHDRAVLEMFRGCSRGCRFCQAGMIYRPVREKRRRIFRTSPTGSFETRGIMKFPLCRSPRRIIPACRNSLIISWTRLKTAASASAFRPSGSTAFPSISRKSAAGEKKRPDAGAGSGYAASPRCDQ